MPPLTHDGEPDYLTWIPAGGIASTDLSQVTQAEMELGVLLGCYLKKGSLSEPSGRNTVDVSVTCDTHDGEAPGTTSGPLSMQLLLQRPTPAKEQEAYDLFKTRADGFFVVRPHDESENVRVYQGTTHTPAFPGNPVNTQTYFDLMFPTVTINVAATYVPTTP